MGVFRSYDVRLFQKLPRLPELPKLCGSSEVKMLDTFKSYQNYHSYQYYGVFQKSWCNRHFQKLPSINECSGDNWTHTEVTLVTNITKISQDFFQKKLWHVSNHYWFNQVTLVYFTQLKWSIERAIWKLAQNGQLTKSMIYYIPNWLYQPFFFKRPYLGNETS